MKKLFTILFVIVSFCAFSQVPTNGLVGYWPFNGNANDESGNNNNGVISGVTLDDDRFGNTQSSYLFDGVDDAITIHVNSMLQFNPLSDSYSIVTWVKSNEPTITYSGRIIEHNDNNPGYTFSLQVGPTSNELVCILWDSTNTPNINVGNIFNDTWQMVCFVVDNSNDSLYAYVNDSLIGQVENTLTNICPMSDTIIIGNSNRLDRPFAGNIDDIRIYDRAINKNEVTALFNEGITGLNEVNDNLISYYPNPTTGNIHIDFPETQENVLIEIFDISGRLVSSKQYEDAKTIQAEIEGCAGVYTVSVQISEGITRQLVIKEQ